ncbi:MAG: tripartite tricarboxylate transporter substrate binding protein [Betaproteobacteria bacterium]|nr:tripartite tricarboxylate transporter substrate binding protein [Betaproteobacteria bacterium]MCC6248602.1 tripartite tricarboxylate transporter substrate binding protein [Rubrivivax sp.]MCL4695787.1 tripartite tricarboxylate transporter substrate binding protein [Burkholderiaceae bacterium]
MKLIAKFAGIALTTAAALLAPSAAQAQAWPAKQPIKFIVVYPPGGASDVTARLLAAKLGESLGQSVVVENKPGANGILATDFVAKSAPDGYTLLMANLGPNALNPVVYKKLPYDAIKDFQGVTLTTIVPQVVVVNQDLPVKSVRDLINYSKANPGKLSFGSAGHGASNHLSGELLNALGGIKMQHIPYKGDAPSIVDLISGQIQLALPTTVAGLPHVKSGKVRAIGVTGLKRLDSMPELPTVAETLPGYEAVSWGGVMVPAGTPRDIVMRLNTEINKILKMPDVADKLRDLGAVIVGSTPEEFDKYVKDEIAKWGKVARDNQIALD